MISLSAVFLLTTVLLQTVFFDSIYARTKKQDIYKALTYILPDISSGVDELQDSCENAAQYYGVCILVTDSNMNKLASAEGSFDSDLLRLPTNALRILYENAEKNGGNYTKEYEQDRIAPHNDVDRANRSAANNQKLKMLLRVSIIATESSGNIAVYITSSISPMKNMTDSLKYQLLLLSIVMLILSTILSYLYSRQISNPIIEMNNEAGKLARGDFDVHFEQSSGSRELDELGEKLNYAAKELSKVDSLRSELIANVSHDLRTPLTLISGYSEMMRDLPGENTPENLSVIIDESKRLSQIVTDILDVSKFQSGVLELNKERFCLTEEVDMIKNRIASLVAAEGYDLVFSSTEEVYVYADRSAISRVLYNLISNAVNYTDDDNKLIEIIQTTSNDKVRIDVMDHGKGISKDDLPYIFDRYYRSSNPHKRSVVGSGIGLSIVKTILTAHEAEFGVTSSPGNGSDFWFTLSISSN